MKIYIFKQYEKKRGKSNPKWVFKIGSSFSSKDRAVKKFLDKHFSSILKSITLNQTFERIIMIKIFILFFSTPAQ